MRPQLRSALACLFSLLLPVLTVHMATPASAKTRTHIFGAFALALDDAVWQLANQGPAHWVLERVDRKQPAFVTVRLVDIGAGTTCGELALAELPNQKFRNPRETIVSVGGVSASLVLAHSGCRSLSPPGQSLCMRNGGKAYLVTQTYARCGFNGVAFHNEKEFAAFLATFSLAPPPRKTP